MSFTPDQLEERRCIFRKIAALEGIIHNEKTLHEGHMDALQEALINLYKEYDAIPAI